MQAIEFRTCQQCGNISTPDSWPFVRWYPISITDAVGDGRMLCEDCAEDEGLATDE